jgi:hypothetical protein
MTFKKSSSLYIQSLYRMIMSIKDKIVNIVIGYPKLVTFGIVIVITFVIGTTIGTLDHSQHVLG